MVLSRLIHSRLLVWGASVAEVFINITFYVISVRVTDFFTALLLSNRSLNAVIININNTILRFLTRSINHNRRLLMVSPQSISRASRLRLLSSHLLFHRSLSYDNWVLYSRVLLIHHQILISK